MRTIDDETRVIYCCSTTSSYSKVARSRSEKSSQIMALAMNKLSSSSSFLLFRRDHC